MKRHVFNIAYQPYFPTRETLIVLRKHSPMAVMLQAQLHLMALPRFSNNGAPMEDRRGAQSKNTINLYGLVILMYSLTPHLGGWAHLQLFLLMARVLSMPWKCSHRKYSTHSIRIWLIKIRITFTYGGIAIDSKGHALTADKRPIPGLLVAGVDAGGFSNLGYAGGLALAFVTGLWAAREACSELGLQEPHLPVPNTADTNSIGGSASGLERAHL